MAERPVFVPVDDVETFVSEVNFNIRWAAGFSATQKKKNVKALHEAAEKEGLYPLLEVSTKSEEIAGQRLSAFYLMIDSRVGKIHLESAYQGSKVFERGGPFLDILHMEPRDAKRDIRLQDSGRLIKFQFEDDEFPLQPMTAFYDWLYMKAVYPFKDWLRGRLIEKMTYAGFTDIEFNPAKSVNCQARSCALLVSLLKRDLLDEAVSSPRQFIEIMREHSPVL